MTKETRQIVEQYIQGAYIERLPSRLRAKDTQQGDNPPTEPQQALQRHLQAQGKKLVSALEAQAQQKEAGHEQ
jgi:hypothetical protein